MSKLMTLKEKFEMALSRRGWFLVPTTRAYRNYSTWGFPNSEIHMYVGKNGSLRRGRTYTNSIPVSVGQKQVMLNGL